MITFDQAVARAEDVLRPVWPSERGTLYIDPVEGWEDDESYLLTVGAKEFLVDGDPTYQSYDDMIFLVDKATGEVYLDSMMVRQGKISAMIPVDENRTMSGT